MDAKTISLVAIMAAVYASVTLLPGFPVIGVPGAEIDIARGLEPSYGIVLGPFFGPMAAFFGAMLGKLLSGETSGIVFTPLALVSSFSAAAVYKERVLKIPGWLLSGILLAFLTLIWFFVPQGQSAPYFAVPHIIATILILSTGKWLNKSLRSENKFILTISLIMISFAATMTGNMLGNLIFIAVFSPPSQFFVALLPLMLLERLLIVAVSTVIGIPIIVGMRRLKILN